ncbi:MAG: hypothetical protein JW830_09165 [Bacteroidales bacterium]|nr:hypothetical protein [Bacteroidales bacterium]
MYGNCLKLVIAFLVSMNLQLLQAQDIPVDSTGAVRGPENEEDTLTADTVNNYSTWDILQQIPIDSVLTRQQNTRFGRGLYQFLIRQNAYGTVRQKTPVSNSKLASKDGMIIRKIEFRNMDIFAPSVEDTMYVSSYGLPKTLNALHKDTRRQILMRHLLLREGEPLDVFLAAENERILRELPYINDARFLVKPLSESPDSIDLVLVTQDLFPVGFDADISSSNSGSMGLWNQNVLGYGLQSALTLYWDGDHKPWMGYGLTVGTSILARSFADAKLEYINRWNLNSVSLDISRNFKSTRFIYAGGALLEYVTAIKNIELLDTVLSDVNLKYTNADLWAGRMFRLNGHSSRVSRGLYFTGRVNLYEKLKGPETSENYLYQYQDRSFYLASVGLSERGYKTDNMIYTFGRTEDVPLGYKLELSAGLEGGQYDIRYYLSGNASIAKYYNRAGYIYASASYGTFLNHGISEQGTLQFRIQYYTKLFSYRRYQCRNFISLNYVNGINRYEGEFVSLENKAGIQGLRSSALRGIDKISLSYESVVFSPFKILGFRFAFYGLIDLGMISPDNFLFKDPKFYSGLGVGVRIRNDQLVFNTFEVSFSVYPGMPADARGEYIRIGSLTRIRLQDFFPQKPDIVRYQ